MLYSDTRKYVSSKTQLEYLTHSSSVEIKLARVQSLYVSIWITLYVEGTDCSYWTLL